MDKELSVGWAGWRRYYHGKVLAFVGHEISSAVVVDDEGRLHDVVAAQLCIAGSAADLANHERFVETEACRGRRAAYDSAYDGVADTVGVPI